MAFLGTVALMGMLVTTPAVPYHKMTIVQQLQILSMMISPLQGFVLIVGSLNMHRIGSRHWTMAGAIAALIPGGFFLLSVLFGIWSLIVLNLPSVKAAFEERSKAWRSAAEFGQDRQDVRIPVPSCSSRLGVFA